MKYLTSITLCLCFVLTIQAQTISQQTYVVDEETEAEAKQQFVDAKNCFFKKQETVSQLWKFDLIDVLNTNINFTDPIKARSSGLSISFEQRITTGRSLNISLVSSFYNVRLDESSEEESGFSSYNDTFYGAGFSVEHRWYLNKKKHIKQGLSGDNLSGIYASFLIGADWKSNKYSFEQEPNIVTQPSAFELRNVQTKHKKSQQQFIVNTGLQRQFAKNGYLDIKIGTGLIHSKRSFDYHVINDQSYNPRMMSDWDWVFNYELGLGFTLDNHEESIPAKDCSVFEYNSDKKRLIKFGLINPHQFIDQDFFYGILTAGIEQKINNSAFSINANVIYSFSYSGEHDHFSDVFIWEIEPRYYYDLSKRMAQGKTGNSLSANYVGFRSNFNFDEENTIRLAPVWGMQRQLFKHLLFDFKLGPELLIEGNTDKDFRFFSELKVGLAF